jgi:hypothetical protein
MIDDVDDIRQTLHRRAGDAKISPDAWKRIEELIAGDAEPVSYEAGRPTDSGRNWTHAILAVAAAIVIVAVAGVVVGSSQEEKVTSVPGDEPRSTTSTTSTSSTSTSTTTEAPTTTVTSVPPGDSESQPTPDAAPAVPPDSTTGTAPPVRLTRDSKVTLSGMGPVEYGMTLEEASEASGLVFKDPYPSNETCGKFAEVEGAPTYVKFGLRNGQIRWVYVMKDSTITTTEGIHVGSTQEDVMRSYDRILVEREWTDALNRYAVLVHLAPGDAGRQFRFHMMNGVVSELEAGFPVCN